ncbi:DNA photolyase, FAD-binding/Cryptochrome [Podospora australis]|uniref:Cryptochrome DASH n=1 Tax=Podospora australis TaxID=1536484 RepID=A0AAN7AID9_9PEZI|nr:DNA photolyase, FAD-binding/Cryptochrome [Podospora australis]
MTKRAVVHFCRRELRVGDNSIINHVADHRNEYDLYIPVYVFPSSQVELSGLIKDGTPNPFPPAKSAVAGYWRTGPHRAKFIAESVWAFKEKLESLGSGLVIRVGNIADIARSFAQGLTDDGQKVDVGAIWMTSHEGSEEKKDERAVESLCGDLGAEFKLWVDEKYFLDDRDVKIGDELPNIFTTYRKNQEPLREKPRGVIPAPTKGSLPRFPANSSIPVQPAPFTIPEALEGLVEALVMPVKHFISDIPPFPENAVSAHPFKGGEEAGHARLMAFIESQGMNRYKDTRNGLFGPEFSTKLSAYLAQGCITARQVHHALLAFEDGTNPRFEGIEGYGKGENEGTKAVRFELLWRDYMRLCHQKFGDKFFRLEGLRTDYNEEAGETPKMKHWKVPTGKEARDGQNPPPQKIAEFLERFNAGTTGMGLIDASQRELMHTGYTSNRARQNVASFLAKHLDIDWRYGAEWYEMLLVDYDVSSNWANWQYVSGVGNDPRGDIRIFNPIKQAFDYDKEGKYVRSWLPELSKLEKLENVFQLCSASVEDVKSAGLAENPMFLNPLKRIHFVVGASPRVNKRGGLRRGRRGSPAVGRAGRPGRSSSDGAQAGDRTDCPESQASGGASLVEDVRTSALYTRSQHTDAPIANGSYRAPQEVMARFLSRSARDGNQNGQTNYRGSANRSSRGSGGLGRHNGYQEKLHASVQSSQAQQSSGV